jgi:hypothetical protein
MNKLSRSVAAAVLVGFCRHNRSPNLSPGLSTVARPEPRCEVSAFRQPKLWPENLTRRWRVGVGRGYATPIVVGNIVYCFSRRGEDEVLDALDADSG